jgi:hypothetical protein
VAQYTHDGCITLKEWTRFLRGAYKKHIMPQNFNGGMIHHGWNIGAIYQVYVAIPTNEEANMRFRGRKRCNCGSIGINIHSNKIHIFKLQL